MSYVFGGGASSRDVQNLLSSPDRDFLIRNNGDQVKLGSLFYFCSSEKGKRNRGLASLLKFLGACVRVASLTTQFRARNSCSGDRFF
ncbi:hypothetical protein NL676_022526 [Syzygium grande]|nr:hypothetical protein NL676_022526 [Syzygium grande]